MESINNFAEAAKQWRHLFFSYCLPSTSSKTGYLTFRKSGVPSSVAFTPLPNSQGQSFYFIDFTAIIVRGTKLSISPTVFSNSGTIIDSGTVITRLPPVAYNALRAVFRQQMAKYATTPALSILDTCYDLSKYTTVSIPKISFLFNGNVQHHRREELRADLRQPSKLQIAVAQIGSWTVFGPVAELRWQRVVVAPVGAGVCRYSGTVAFPEGLPWW
ncbi:hypothetical protein RJ640_015425 [Escallonia rubra]|uniref:Xylanase inhibitor C-terminal domain-containing protein n=1 Tax=Escallonia rubra TaxID=112253 RepID=A0AA88U2J9_9ASTE|nr:hypothetical protein RJ640_015425 [Escallonia rubra]